MRSSRAPSRSCAAAPPGSENQAPPRLHVSVGGAGKGARAATRERGWVAVLGLLLLLCSGCFRGCPSRQPPIHLNPNMDNQPKYLPQSESQYFYDGATMRTPVEGTVARGALTEDDELHTGKSSWGFYLTEVPFQVTGQVIARGRERYQIYCSPCHGAGGNGEGMLFQRSKVRSANLLGERIRRMPDGQIFGVISNGVGLMPSYAYPIPPRDRWAIIAWLRQLQQQVGRE